LIDTGQNIRVLGGGAPVELAANGIAHRQIGTGQTMEEAAADACDLVLYITDSPNNRRLALMPTGTGRLKDFLPVVVIDLQLTDLYVQRGVVSTFGRSTTTARSAETRSQ